MSFGSKGVTFYKAAQMVRLSTWHFPGKTSRYCANRESVEGSSSRSPFFIIDLAQGQGCSMVRVKRVQSAERMSVNVDSA